MTDDSSQYSDTQPKWIALTLLGIALTVAGLTPAIHSLLPDYARPWNMSVIGAIGLFAASRLRFLWAVWFMAIAIALKDVGFYFARGYYPDPLSLPCFILYAAIGWAFLRRSQSPLRVGASALSSSLLFFFVSNFTSWLNPNLGYEQSFSGLVNCYIAGIPFFRGTLLGDLVFTGALFGAYAVMGRAYLPVRQPVAVEAEHKG
jgi:hypothetical protein